MTDTMGESTKRLFIYLAIGVAVAIITAYFLYQDRKVFWEEQARGAFVEVIKKEVQKRSGAEVYFASSGNVKLPVEKKGPITVTLESKDGKKDYIIPEYKYLHNIEEDPTLQGMQSILFKNNPLNADSLNIIWNDFLEKSGFRGKSITRLSVIDLLDTETRAYSRDSIYVSKSDSLISCYIGHRSEIEVTGFVYYPWWQAYSLKNVLQLCGIILGCFLLFLLFEKSGSYYRRFLIKASPVIVEKIVVVENDILVKATEAKQIHVYQLDEGVQFDVKAKCLKKGDILESMLPQSVILLQGLLEAKDYRLSIEEIWLLLWPNGSGTSQKMHMAVGRLRASLSKVSGCLIENGNYGYQLIIPDSIEKSN